MKLRVERSAVAGILRWSQRVLLAGAVGTLGYCGYLVLDSWKFQRDEGLALQRVINVGPTAVPHGSHAAPVALTGRLEVRRVGLSAMVVEGTTTKDLRRAAGHIAGTGMPGLPGNVGIAAHRDTFFRPLRSIRKNDVITLTTGAVEYRYRVVSTNVVEPDDVSVLNSSDDEILTLVTCYPFFFVGSAPQRFIVRAERIT